MRRRNPVECPTLDACKRSQLRQLWEQLREDFLPHCSVENAERNASDRLAREAWREWCNLESAIEDQPYESEILLFEWLEKRDWMQIFAEFSADIHQAEERDRARFRSEHEPPPKPRVLDLVRVDDPYRLGWDILINGSVRKAWNHRVGESLAFCASKDDAERLRHRLYAAYLRGTDKGQLAPYTQIIPAGRKGEPIRLINKALLVKRTPPVYVQRAEGQVTAYEIYRYPASRDERFIVGSVAYDEQDFEPGYLLTNHEDIVAEIYLMGDPQVLVDLACFYDPIASIEWSAAEQQYQCQPTLIGYESLEKITTPSLQAAVEETLFELERLLARDIAARARKRQPRERRKRKQPSRKAFVPGPMLEEVEPQYRGLTYLQAVERFILEMEICERCHLALLYGEFQEALSDVEQLLNKASVSDLEELVETFQIGVRYALKRVGNFCRSCEGRLQRAARRELLPLVVFLYAPGGPSNQANRPSR